MTSLTPLPHWTANHSFACMDPKGGKSATRAALRSILAIMLGTIAVILARPGLAQEAPSDFDVSANVAVVSDYRFRGLSYSGGDPAIQGGLDVSHASGVYIGGWVSPLDEDSIGYGDTELDLYAGYAADLGNKLSVAAAIFYYIYPDAGAGHFDYWEPLATLSAAVGSVGPVEATLGTAYSSDQSSLDYQEDGAMTTGSIFTPTPRLWFRRLPSRLTRILAIPRGFSPTMPTPSHSIGRLAYR